MKTSSSNRLRYTLVSSSKKCNRYPPSHEFPIANLLKYPYLFFDWDESLLNSAFQNGYFSLDSLFEQGVDIIVVILFDSRITLKTILYLLIFFRFKPT